MEELNNPSVCVIVAPGFEEVETSTPVDFLRRAGIRVQLLGVGDTVITGSRQLSVVTDSLVEDCQELPDAVVLPGGMPGAENIFKSEAARSLVSQVWKNNGIVAAICAAPAVALGGWGMLGEKHFTCFPGFEDGIAQGVWSDQRVVWDSPLLTSRGPGTAAEFALKLVSLLSGVETAKKIARTTLQPESTIESIEA